MDNETMKEGKGKGPPKAVVAAIIAAVVIISAVIVLSKRERYEPVGPGKPALDFTLPDLAGRPVSLKDYRGRSCSSTSGHGQALQENASMQACMTASRASRLESAVKPRLRAGGGKKFVESYRYIPGCMTGKGREEDYKTTGVPETFIITRAGHSREDLFEDWTERDSIATM